MTLLRSFLVSGLFLTLTAVRADERTVPGFLVRPVVTDFQKSQLYTNPSAVAVVHGQSFMEGDVVRQESAELNQLQVELQSAAQRSNTRLHVVLWLPVGAFKKPDRWKGLEEAVRARGKDAGFQNVDITRRGTSSSWAEELSELLDQPDEGLETVEPVVQNPLVRVSPIKTVLSRFLGGDADCVVDIRNPFDGRSQEFPDVLNSAIQEAIKEAKPSRREKLHFHVTSTTAGRRVVDRLFGSGENNASIDRLARQFGFATGSFHHSDCAGAPEALINQPAPDFSLERLEGGGLTLSEAIRGKPAFVSFWGVACGPCRREAPHLTTLHKQFDKQGFVIIAVNAYDEKRETVQAFVNKVALSHPIVLMGQKVASDQYRVGAYPTAYWIDHTGRIVDYTIDYIAGDEIEMADRMAKMLKAAK